MPGSRIAITGGAGYIGSLLTGELLRRGHQVTVLDTLLFGGESLLAHLAHPGFAFRKVDVADRKNDLVPLLEGIEIVFHLAAIVGFPACQQIGEQAAWHYNVEATQRVFQAAETAGVSRIVFASTYSNYGIAEGGAPVTETSPLRPQSLYARTKIASEEYLLEQGRRSPVTVVIPRFATLYGISPRTRFDLIVNQFVLEALTKRKLVIYQGDYTRSFIHVGDVVDALIQMAEAPAERVRNEIFNVAAANGNYSKLAARGAHPEERARGRDRVSRPELRRGHARRGRLLREDRPRPRVPGSPRGRGRDRRDPGRDREWPDQGSVLREVPQPPVHRELRRPHGSPRQAHPDHRWKWVPGVSRGEGSRGEGLSRAVRAAEP